MITSNSIRQAYHMFLQNATMKTRWGIIGIIVLSVALSGCANIAQVYLPEGDIMKEVVRVKLSGPGIITFKPETQEVTVDTKQLSWWDKFVTPVLQEANGKAQGQVGIN